MAAVGCSSCGRAIELPEGYTRAKIRCPGCGYYAEVPSELRQGADDATPARPGSSETSPTPNKPLPTARKVSPAAVPSASPFDDAPAQSGSHNPLTEESYTFAGSPPAPAPSRRGPVAEKPAPKPRPQADPLDHRPNFEPDEPSGDPLLHGTQDEDDDLPYGVPGTGVQVCKHCKGKLPLTAQFCVHCGRDLETGEKAKKVYQPMYREWEEGYSLATRLQFLAGLQVLNLVAFVVGAIAQELSFKDMTGIIINLIFGLIQVGLQAFLAGTYDTIQLNRNAKGQSTITRIRRIAFIPLPAVKINWKEHCMIGTVGSHDPGIFAWGVCAYLFLFACLPGILFYWFVIRPERFIVSLANEYGSPELSLFRTTNRELAVEISDIISEATKLQFKQVL